MDAAASLSIIGILITLIFVYLNVHFQSSMTYHEQINTPKVLKTKYKFNKYFNPGTGLYILIIVLLVAAPVVSVIIKSFLHSGSDNTTIVSLSAYRDILNPSPGNYGTTLLRAILNSISYASYTVILSILIGTLVSFILRGKNRSKKILDTLFMLPISVSSVILGLGYLKVMNYIQ
jgi:thiamine transport system permease protein